MIELPYFLECFSFSLFFCSFELERLDGGVFYFFYFFLGKAARICQGTPANRVLLRVETRWQLEAFAGGSLR